MAVCPFEWIVGGYLAGARIVPPVMSGSRFGDRGSRHRRTDDFGTVGFASTPQAVEIEGLDRRQSVASSGTSGLDEQTFAASRGQQREEPSRRTIVDDEGVRHVAGKEHVRAGISSKGLVAAPECKVSFQNPECLVLAPMNMKRGREAWCN